MRGDLSDMLSYDLSARYGRNEISYTLSNTINPSLGPDSPTSFEPGDLITTGTPPGVGMGQKPEPVYLKAGDEIRLGIEKLGEQRQIVVAWSKEGVA